MQNFYFSWDIYAYLCAGIWFFSLFYVGRNILKVIVGLLLMGCLLNLFSDWRAALSWMAILAPLVLALDDDKIYLKMSWLGRAGAVVVAYGIGYWVFDSWPLGLTIVVAGSAVLSLAGLEQTPIFGSESATRLPRLSTNSSISEPVKNGLGIAHGHARRTLALRTGVVLPEGNSRYEMKIDKPHSEREDTFLVTLPEVNKSRKFWAVLTADQKNAKTFYFGQTEKDIESWFSTVPEEDQELKDDLTLDLRELRQEYRRISEKVRRRNS